MLERHDVLIVGAGLFGAACGYELTRRGARCLVLEKKKHVGGNCYTEQWDGINVHVYGPHIFHTSHKPTWDWINQFATFNHYRHRVKVVHGHQLYSFPLNLSTFYQLWGVRSPEEARQRIEDHKVACNSEESLEAWAISQVGRDLYEIFIKGYTEKQWGRLASDLPAAILKRIPIRLTYDDDYFSDKYQGIPIGGYTPIFEKLLAKAHVQTNVDYFDDRTYFDSLAERVIYTGPVDRFHEYCFGKLEYRSLRFEHQRLETSDFQGIAQLNYSSVDVPYTRIVEHKHFEFDRQRPVTWITREYPVEAGDGCDEMYPIRDDKNLETLRRYQNLSKRPEYGSYYVGGRLGEYRYYDMHQVIEAAVRLAHNVEQDLRESPRNKGFHWSAPTEAGEPVLG